MNPTLDTGRHRRIVEFQSRREFEGFGSLPNDLAGLHQQALRGSSPQNPRVEGIWNWTQDGGPLRAGPMSLYLRTGFWQLYDLNTYAAARLAWDPDTPPEEITADWVRQTFSTDPATAPRSPSMFALSREAITTGLYIGPYADKQVKALGLEPPPMMWIFEWDIVTGDSAALDSIYAVSRDRLDEAIADGDRAVALVARMRDLVAGTDPATWRDPALRHGSPTPSTTRSTCSRRWPPTGRWSCGTRSGSTPAAPRPASSGARRGAATRPARPGTWPATPATSDLPAYNFTAADLGARARRPGPRDGLAGARPARPGRCWSWSPAPPTATRPAAPCWLGATRPWRLRRTAANPAAGSSSPSPPRCS